jgi:hypothetical protein
MHSRFDVQTRRRMLDHLKNVMMDDSGSSDPDLAIKRTVIRWISEHGGVGQRPGPDTAEEAQIIVDELSEHTE